MAKNIKTFLTIVCAEISKVSVAHFIFSETQLIQNIAFPAAPKALHTPRERLETSNAVIARNFLFLFIKQI